MSTSWGSPEQFEESQKALREALGQKPKATAIGPLDPDCDHRWLSVDLGGYVTFPADIADMQVCEDCGGGQVRATLGTWRDITVPPAVKRDPVKVYRDLDDWWVGYYRGPNHHYVCPLPTLVIRWPRRGR